MASLGFDSFGRPWATFGRPCSVWSALGLPLAVLWGPLRRPGTYGAVLKFIELLTIIDEGVAI